jgi:hypothetical protein
MVAKGNKDQHRYTYSGGVKAQETSKWGANKARERYGSLDTPNMKAADKSFPEFRADQPVGGRYEGETPQNWLRGANERGYPPGKPIKR